ncbi:MAG TPA: ScyD/ScyE family protein [Pyrinomonadaceae bacterium]|jgi:glucose/arabinose dehydrogenase|nr:ScyD/ScyE family protein [Pyrinomonadaceae bacterium]
MKFKTLFTAAALSCALAASAARAQSVSVFSGGLKAPSKLVMTPRGNLLVAEGGDGPNKGRVSLIDRKTRARRTVLDGLPAGPSIEGGISGPSGLALEGDTVYVVIGAGDGTIAGPASGTEKPNPNPSSPLLSSVLAVKLPASFEESNAQGPTLTPADHSEINGGGVFTSGVGANRVSVELLTNFANYEAAPRPDFADNVRASNPFGVAVNGRLLYVVDASLNKVSVVGADSGAVSTLATFAPIANPLPFGPPFIDAVPDSVRLVGDSLLVPTLTGFPFPARAASVRQISTVTGESESYVTNLTTAIDVLTYQGEPDRRSAQAAADADEGTAEAARLPNRMTHYLALEFSTNFLQNAPGRLLFDSHDSNPVVLAEPLISPTSMARDPRNGDIFITSMFPGLVVRVAHARLLALQHYRDFLGREPDEKGWNFWAGEMEKCGTDDACNDRKAVDVSRAFYYSAEFIGRHPELEQSLRGTPQYNREFVRQGYYAYLRRNCDAEICDPEGFNFWVGKLNSRLPSRDADYNEMIRAFLVSAEYRSRFGLN